MQDCTIFSHIGQWFRCSSGERCWLTMSLPPAGGGDAKIVGAADPAAHRLGEGDLGVPCAGELFHI